jgi:hypothetical protein
MNEEGLTMQRAVDRIGKGMTKEERLEVQHGLEILHASLTQDLEREGE